ncbi:MAG: UDP-N-acetylmuramate--L-alanine ligase [Burkholderiales bacterium]
MRHRVKRVHFVGIGGSGMSGIAEVMLTQGFQVSGSDLGNNATTQRLQSLGANVVQGHVATNISGADVVVISTAVKADNAEVVAAREQHIPVVPRAMMLAELMRLRQGIAVAGTHGKTTTTSLIASILGEAQMDPTFVIGGRLEAVGANARLGRGDFIVVEADESDASFLYLQPVLAVVTNIDADHMETYGHDFEKLKSAFVDFVEHLPFYGLAVLCADDPHVTAVIPRITKAVMTYGASEGVNIRAVDIRADGGQMHYTAIINDSHLQAKNERLDITLNLPGVHNVLNSLAAIAVALETGATRAAIVKALAEFKGVGRRFQRFGEINLSSGGTFTLIDDYGHHPVEMAATIAAARGAYPERRLLLAFQPHRYSRTRDVFEDFVKVLSSVDVLLLTEVYAAGEAPIVAADGRSLARAIRLAAKVEPLFVDQVQDVPGMILEIARPGDVVLTMGAGSINQVPASLTQQNKQYSGAMTQ